MIEPIELSYDLFPLPTGRVSFRRWRWELWHGPRLLAAGWRFKPLDAQRALRTHALRFAHRVHGLHLLRPELAGAPDDGWLPGGPMAIDWGEIRIRLIPRPHEAAPERRVTSAQPVARSGVSAVAESSADTGAARSTSA